MCYTLRYKQVIDRAERLDETTTLTRETLVTPAAAEKPAEPARTGAYGRFRAGLLQKWSHHKQKHLETA